MGDYSKALTIKITAEQQEDLNKLVLESKKNKSEFVRDCIFGGNTNGNTKNNIYKTACKQLIDIFDNIFKIDYPKTIRKELIEILSIKLDKKIIDKVKGLLRSG